MTQDVLSGAVVFDGVRMSPASVGFDQGKITHVEPAGENCGTRLSGGILLSGYVDLQVNGGGGVQFNAAPTAETLRIMADAHAKLGAMTILPTLITDSPDVQTRAIAAAAEAIKTGVQGLAGLHLEGPHLAVAKAGAHDPALIRSMTDADLSQLLEAAKLLPLLKVTLAPESVTPEQIQILSANGVLVSLGHSNCSAHEARVAADAGARCATHLFNAMSPLRHRDPGLVGAVLEDGRMSCGLIADGIHVDPLAMQMAIRAKVGPGRLFLVSDAMAVAGSDLTEFRLNGRAVYRRNGQLVLGDATLAGADLDLTSAIRCLANTTDVSLLTALQMATSVPAALIGRSGRLVAGAPADLVWLSDNLELSGVWQAGVRIV